MGFLNRMRLISKYYRPFSAPDAAVPQGGGSFIPALLCSIGVPAAVFGSGYIGFSVAAALPVAGVGAVAAGLALLILPILAGAVSCYLLLSLVVRLSAAVSDNEQACCDARNSFEAFRRMDYRAQAEYLRQLPKNLGGSLRGVQCSTGLLNEFLDLAIEKLENPALADEVKQTAFRSVASMYVYMCIVSAKCDATSSITKRLQQAFLNIRRCNKLFWWVSRGHNKRRGAAERQCRENFCDFYAEPLTTIVRAEYCVYS